MARVQREEGDLLPLGGFTLKKTAAHGHPNNLTCIRCLQMLHWGELHTLNPCGKNWELILFQKGRLKKSAAKGRTKHLGAQSHHTTVARITKHCAVPLST